MKKVLFSLIMALVAVPVFAVEFESGDFKANIYGEIYGDAFYTYSEGNGESSNSFGSQAFVGSSLLGIELSYGNVSATFEAGLGDPVRRYFLTYRIGGAEDHYLVVGRDTTIAAYSFGMVSNDFQALNDLGTLADNRRLQIRYGLNGFELAVIIPSLGGAWNADNTDDTGYKLSDVNETTNEALFTPFNVLPRIELAYTYATDALEFKVFGAYGAYMYSDNSKIASDKVFHSYNVGFGGQANFGNSFLQFTGWYGANLDLMDALGNYKSRVVSVQNNKISMFLDDGVTKAENIQSAGVAIGLGHTFNEKYTPQIGVGYTLNFGDGYEKMDDSLGAYLNCVIQINDWFAITPEIAYINKMQDSTGAKEGFDFIAGAMASVVF
ncbi:MAG: hypothetical protein ROM03_08520 [Mucispirillum sp.]|nr:hypothetical protein [Mucispirillum sp.]